MRTQPLLLLVGLSLSSAALAQDTPETTEATETTETPEATTATPDETPAPPPVEAPAPAPPAAAAPPASVPATPAELETESRYQSIIKGTGAGTMLDINDYTSATALTAEERATVEQNLANVQAALTEARDVNKLLAGRERTAAQRIKLAKSELKSAKVNLKTAKQEVKLAKVDPETDANAAASNYDDAVEALDAAKKKLKVTKLALALAKKESKHGEALVAREESKVAVADALLSSPPPEETDLLKLESSREKAIQKEAKARGDVAKAKLKLREAQAAE